MSKILLTLGKFFQTLFTIGENFGECGQKQNSNRLVTLFEPGANPINDLQAYKLINTLKIPILCIFKLMSRLHS